MSVDPITVLIGPNGSGKSCLLRAIEMFYDPNVEYDEHDFYDRDKDIEITVTYTDLTLPEKELFKAYAEGEDLTVEKILTWPPPTRGRQSRTAQRYYGKRLQNPDFESFRQARGVSALRDEYQKIQQKYSLPNYPGKDETEQLLKQWETKHTNQCARVRDDGQFFGFKEVGESRLERHTRYIPIPAVCDAGEEVTEGRGTTISEIRDILVESELAQKEEYANLRNETRDRYRNVLPQLVDLSTRVTRTLQTFVPASKVDFSWEEMEGVDLPTPRVATRLLEDGHMSPVGKTGHGLQRAFIVAMLQELTLSHVAQPSDKSQDMNQESAALSSLIIGIEEPELYQHPDRQRHLSAVLLKLSAGSIAGVTDRVQVIYSTHSPLLVDLERFEHLRMFQKVSAEGDKPKHVSISFATLEDIARSLEHTRGEPKLTYSGDSVKPHLQVLMTPWFNEGFFLRDSFS